MSGAARFARAIREAGAEAVLRADGAELRFMAAIQPTLSPPEEDGSVIGQGPPPRFVLYAPCGGAADRLQKGDRILWAGGFYRVLRAQRYMLRGSPLYWWAALCGETEEDDMV